MRKITFIFLCLCIGLAAPSQAQTVPLPDLLEEDFEIELALSALPQHLRADAGIYLLKRGGYVEIKAPQNGFTCFVRRMGAVPGRFYDSLAPVCYDKEGTDTLVPALLDEIIYIEQGMPAKEVAAKIKEGWDSGKYTVPGPGISYMLSPIFRVVTGQGHIGSYVPHLMFYGPYKSNEQIGGTNERLSYTPFMQAPGFPSGMMVVPAGKAERAQIMEQEKDLIAKVDTYLAKRGNTSP